MARDKGRRLGPPGATVTGALALLLVVCLVECATEQRINSRGRKPSHVEKINAWRSQRGVHRSSQQPSSLLSLNIDLNIVFNGDGTFKVDSIHSPAPEMKQKLIQGQQNETSCTSYGHSCWGAHGKRSVNPPGTAPDWYLSKLLRRMDADNNDIERIQRAADDSSGIYMGDGGIDVPSTNQLESDNEDYSLEPLAPKPPEAKPMLDGEMLSNYKLWKFMVKRETPVE